MIVTVDPCPRCGTQHVTVSAQPKRPGTLHEGTVYKWQARCPTEGASILLRLDEEGAWVTA